MGDKMLRGYLLLGVAGAVLVLGVTVASLIAQEPERTTAFQLTGWTGRQCLEWQSESCEIVKDPAAEPGEREICTYRMFTIPNVDAICLGLGCQEILKGPGEPEVLTVRMTGQVALFCGEPEK